MLEILNYLNLTMSKRDLLENYRPRIKTPNTVAFFSAAMVLLLALTFLSFSSIGTTSAAYAVKAQQLLLLKRNDCKHTEL